MSSGTIGTSGIKKLYFDTYNALNFFKTLGQHSCPLNYARLLVNSSYQDHLDQPRDLRNLKANCQSSLLNRAFSAFFLRKIFSCIFYLLSVQSVTFSCYNHLQKNFLEPSPMRPNTMKRDGWKLNHVNFITISYLCCVMPWIVNQLREGILTEASSNNNNNNNNNNNHNNNNNNSLVEFYILFIYLLNFMLPSGLFIYLKMLTRKGGSKKKHSGKDFEGLKVSYL